MTKGFGGHRESGYDFVMETIHKPAACSRKKLQYAILRQMPFNNGSQTYKKNIDKNGHIAVT